MNQEILNKLNSTPELSPDVMMAAMNWCVRLCPLMAMWMKPRWTTRILMPFILCVLEHGGTAMTKSMKLSMQRICPRCANKNWIA